MPTQDPPKGDSHRQIAYVCSQCGANVGKDKLTVKRVMFQTAGMRFKTLRSRVVAWLCQSCRDEDPAWCAPPRATAPGLADTKLARGES